MPRYRFAQFTDLHLGGSGLPKWHNRELLDDALELTHKAVEEMNVSRPDFVVVTGDLTHCGDRASFVTARAELDRLQMKYFVLPGNHDLMRPGARSDFHAIFGEHAAPTGLWEWGGVRHFILDTRWWCEADSKVLEAKRTEQEQKSASCRPGSGYSMIVPPEQICWLAAELEKHPNQPTLIFCHLPIIEMEPGFWQRGYSAPDAGCLRNGPALIDVFQRHHQVRAVFCGHQHFNQITRVRAGEADREMLHCTLCATIEYPMMWREVIVDDVVSVATHELPVESLRQQSLIGKTTSWVRGEAKDLTAQINL